MSFERYHPSKLNMESTNNNHNHNGNNHVHLKYAPVKIIHNDIANCEERRKYPQLNLRFQPADETITRQDPTVTIPLSFLQQLIQQAYSNKQLRTLNNPSFRVEENRNDAVEELIKQIEIQQKGIYPIDEEKKIQNVLIQNQMNFIFQNEEAIQLIETYFSENTNLKPHFKTWLQQLEVKAIQDMLILCHSDPKGQQYSDLFKSLFQKLSIEFYQKHAYAQVLRSEYQEKLKYLSQIGEILNKIHFDLFSLQFLMFLLFNLLNFLNFKKNILILLQRNLKNFIILSNNEIANLCLLSLVLFFFVYQLRKIIHSNIQPTPSTDIIKLSYIFVFSNYIKHSGRNFQITYFKDSVCVEGLLTKISDFPLANAINNSSQSQ